MSKDNEGVPMLQASSLPDLPPSKKTEKRVLKQAEVPEKLWKAVSKAAAKSGGYTTQQIIEYGMIAFLLKLDPEAAEEFL